MNCLHCDIGPSIFDIRHNFTANAVYELPFGPGKTYLNDSGFIDGVKVTAQQWPSRMDLVVRLSAAALWCAGVLLALFRV